MALLRENSKAFGPGTFQEEQDCRNSESLCRESRLLKNWQNFGMTRSSRNKTGCTKYADPDRSQTCFQSQGRAQIMSHRCRGSSSWIILSWGALGDLRSTDYVAGALERLVNLHSRQVGGVSQQQVLAVQFR